LIVFLLIPSTECGGIPITQSSQWLQGSEVSWRVIGNILFQVRDHQEILRNASEILDDLDFIHHEYASGQDKILPAAE
jgi:hypothetical protein